MRYILQGSYFRLHARLAPIALTGLVLLLVVCLSGVGGFFSYQLSSHVGESGPESRGLQGGQPLALVRYPEFLGRLWQEQNPNPQSGEPPTATGDAFICPSITVGACPLVASIEPTIFLNLPTIGTQVAKPQQPRAPPEALAI